MSRLLFNTNQELEIKIIASLTLLVGQQLLIMFLMTHQIVLLKARLIQVVLFATLENAFKIAPAIRLLMDLQVLL